MALKLGIKTTPELACSAVKTLGDKSTESAQLKAPIKIKNIIGFIASNFSEIS
jgi:hypothetical protein